MNPSTLFRSWNWIVNGLIAWFLYYEITRAHYPLAAAVAFWFLAVAIDDVWVKLHLYIAGVR